MLILLFIVPRLVIANDFEKYENELVLLEDEAGKIKANIIWLEKEIESLKTETDRNRKMIMALNQEINNIIRILYFINLEKRLNHFIYKDIETKNIRYGEYIRSILLKYNENLRGLKELNAEYDRYVELLSTKLENSIKLKKELDTKIDKILLVMSEKEKNYEKTAFNRKKIVIAQREESSKKIDEFVKKNVLKETGEGIQKKSDPFRIIWPVRQGDVIREFGGYYDDIMNLEKFSRGIIIKAPFLSEVFCVSDGKAIFSGWLKGFGNTVIIEHSQGFLSVYSHLARAEISKGDNVKEKDIIGFVGDTGSNEGVILYFELRENGKAVDPMNYIK